MHKSGHACCKCCMCARTYSGQCWENLLCGWRRFGSRGTNPEKNMGVFARVVPICTAWFRRSDATVLRQKPNPKLAAWGRRAPVYLTLPPFSPTLLKTRPFPPFLPTSPGLTWPHQACSSLTQCTHSQTCHHFHPASPCAVRIHVLNPTAAPPVHTDSFHLHLVACLCINMPVSSFHETTAEVNPLPFGFTTLLFFCHYHQLATNFKS